MKLKPSVSVIKKLRPFSWADFKHKLFQAGVLPNPTSNVPKDWQEAFTKTFRT